MSEDTDKCCRCVCFGNGALGIVAIQVLFFMGGIFSAAVMGDCSLVKGTPNEWLPPPVYNPDDFPTGEPPNFDIDPIEYRGRDKVGAGFFFWELENGDCSWQLFDEDYPDWWLEELWRTYFDLVLDSQWKVALVFSAIVTNMAWIMVVVSCTFNCLTQARPARYALGGFVVVVMVCFQNLAFVAFKSDFCAANDDCEMSRTGWFVIASTLCYFFAGLCFCFGLKDYPGKAKEDVVVTSDGGQEEPQTKGEEPEPKDEEKGGEEKPEEPQKVEESPEVAKDVAEEEVVEAVAVVAAKEVAEEVAQEKSLEIPKDEPDQGVAEKDTQDSEPCDEAQQGDVPPVTTSLTAGESKEPTTKVEEEGKQISTSSANGGNDEPDADQSAPKE